MKKVKLHIKLISNNNLIDEKTTGKIDDDLSELTYFENSSTKVKFNYKKNILIRENKDLKLEFNFQKDTITTGVVNIKELGKILKLKIKTIDIKNEKDSIRVKYLLEEDEYLYVINMEE